jgi:methylenetetrahydrofolate dehydrogenase (NADP+)/methenyltetrahydrofolate cyclohydrolase
MEKNLSGKPVANLINKASMKLIADFDVKPRMCLIQVGCDPASSYYVQSIISSGAKLGCICELISLDPEATEAELLACIDKANKNPDVHGIMIQKPLPRHINDNKINLAINPAKDLDSLHPVNLGKIMMDADGFLPCTPAAVFYTMQYYDINPQGKNLVIVGRSNVVGKPLANMLLWKKTNANATVTVCHSQTRDLHKITSQADILIAAIGKPRFIQREMIKENCILLDVGINEVVTEDGKSVYVGDIDFYSCADKALAITPVPGGIGRITTSVLYLNLVKACLEQHGVNKSIDEYIALIFSVNHKEE